MHILFIKIKHKMRQFEYILTTSANFQVTCSMMPYRPTQIYHHKSNVNGGVIPARFVVVDKFR